MFELGAATAGIWFALVAGAGGSILAVGVLSFPERVLGGRSEELLLWSGASFGVVVWSVHLLTGSLGTGHASGDPIWLGLVLVWTAMSAAAVFTRVRAARSDSGLIGSGLLLGAVVSLSHVAVDFGPDIDFADVDLLGIAVSSAVGLAASGAAVILLRMPLGRGRLVGAACLLTLAVSAASLHDPSAYPGLVSLVEQSNAVQPVHTLSVGTLAVLALIAGAVLFAVARRGVSGWGGGPESAGFDVARAEARDHLETLRACLDMMSVDQLSLLQRSRLDVARASAADLASALDPLSGGFGFVHRIEAPQTSVSSRVSSVDGHAAAAASRRVLLVDDVALNRTVLGAMLKRLGVSVDVATDGRAALEAMRRQAFDLVLMDTDMPGMNGLDATEVARADPELRHQAIVGLSADVVTERGEATDAGMDDVVPKQMTLDRLAALIDRWTGEPGHARRAPSLTSDLGYAGV